MMGGSNSELLGRCSCITQKIPLGIWGRNGFRRLKFCHLNPKQHELVSLVKHDRWLQSTSARHPNLLQRLGDVLKPAPRGRRAARCFLSTPIMRRASSKLPATWLWAWWANSMAAWRVFSACSARALAWLGWPAQDGCKWLESCIKHSEFF